ncbi:MAG TPA: cation:proton antiporter [Burkholderiaceae bacterium]
MVGALLVSMALGRTVLDRLPFSSAMVYLLVGLAVSPLWLDLARFDFPAATLLLERGTEAVVLFSLFTSGLKLSAGLDDRRWLLPVRLATLSMIATVAGVALAGWALLGLSPGAAVLLGGILAPTDPVLASDVQLNDPRDRDRLRFALTGEGGLNDGTAFPIVMLGLGLLGLHDLGAGAWRWWAIDVVWSTLSGLAIGALFGTAVGRLVLHLRRERSEALGLDDFLSLGLVALSYGVAILLHGSGFLAVFAAGVALRRTERRATADAMLEDGASDGPSGGQSDVQSDSQNEAETQPRAARVAEAAYRSADPADARSAATDARSAPAYLAHAVMSFNEQLERIGEVASVIAVGALLWAVAWPQASWWFVALLFLVIRPVSVAIGILGTPSSRTQRRLIAWFGIRGIGSVFYLTYATSHGVEAELARTLTALVLSAVVASIVLHGISVTPLMLRYQRRTRVPTRLPR